MTGQVRRVATYERVSSEDQRDRQTIRTQTEELARQLRHEPAVELIERYVDDGVSGTIPMSERPAGSRLLDDAARRRFDEVWVYKIDRLGRDDVDPLIIWRDLERLGITVRSVTEGVSSLFEYHIRVAMAAEERRTSLARLSAGLERAVHEGRYPGGIVTFGYKAQGERENARLIPDDRIIWGGLTAADVVRRIFRLIADEGWGTARVADELNRLGIPTAYAFAGRGVRGKSTQKVWRPGRMVQILHNTTYYGEYRYGKRSSLPSGRPVVSVEVPAILSKDVWDAAQEALRSRRRKQPGQRKKYLLRSLITCEICGLNYTGSTSHGDVWYRCNGQLAGRGPLEGRCPAKGVKGEYIEPVIKHDIEAFLRNPGALLDELASELDGEQESTAAIAEAEQTTLTEALKDVEARRNRLLDLYLDDRFDRDELRRRLDRLEAQQADIQERLDELEPVPVIEPEPLDRALLPELLRLLDAGLDDDQWHEIISLLVPKIGIHTTELGNGKKQAKAVVVYRFNSVVETFTGTPAGQNYTLRRVVVL